MSEKYTINPARYRLLQDGSGSAAGPVIYWMSREQRAEDNWGLLFSLNLALQNQKPLITVFTLAGDFLGATLRQYDFMFGGLAETEKNLEALNIPFVVLKGNPPQEMAEFVRETGATDVVSDFDPLKIKRVWKRDFARDTKARFWEVDSHNVVPALHVTDKEEFGAYTIRPKITRKLGEFLTDIPAPEPYALNNHGIKQANNYTEILASLNTDKEVKPVKWLKPGSAEGKNNLELFISKKLRGYSEERNDPTLKGQSDLSPYFHFGQLSPQRAAWEAFTRAPESESKQAFLEELIVRRELADNYCYFNKKYDLFDGFKDWAKKTLNDHRDDKRDYIYNEAQFEKGETHEDLWNAAQKEMIKKGKMHGFMRMYWAKKILEWSESPEEALRIAVYLNDKYELDGRDPNGYTGVAWSIGGIHDRAWTERPVYGKIRYMNYNGCKRKFDTSLYIAMNS
ncbi:MAG: deoxyribodipyrimidine photo-lyase [Ignavibacteriaceae bacterium]|nr:deoxyribodipyrimidine photo-lyase [Ignavibacteriaceae bacterium]